MARAISCYYPGRAFPSISTTGTACALNCKHCAGRYLRDMIPASTPEELLVVGQALAEQGARGFLLSGGADLSGRVRLDGYLEAIRSVKSTTDLLINAHIGLSSTTEIRDLVDAGVDAFSVDVFGSRATIREVLGIDAGPEDYVRVLEDLQASGARIIAPHICVGVHAGKLKGEFEAIRLLRGLEPEILIVISLIPTNGTGFSNVSPPSRDEVLAVIDRAREEMPGTRLVLGCMRRRGDRSLERDAVIHGIEGLALPASRTVKQLEAEGFVVKKKELCCALM